MPTLLPVPDTRLMALVLVALVGVSTMAATVQAPAATLAASTASQDERFQPPQQRALPPFGTRTVLAPVSETRPRLTGAEAAR